MRTVLVDARAGVITCCGGTDPEVQLVNKEDVAQERSPRRPAEVSVGSGHARSWSSVGSFTAQAGGCAGRWNTARRQELGV